MLRRRRVESGAAQTAAMSARSRPAALCGSACIRTSTSSATRSACSPSSRCSCNGTSVLVEVGWKISLRGSKLRFAALCTVTYWNGGRSGASNRGLLRSIRSRRGLKRTANISQGPCAELAKSNGRRHPKLLRWSRTRKMKFIIKTTRPVSLQSLCARTSALSRAVPCGAGTRSTS